MVTRMPDPAEATRQYRRGAVMGLTVAEAFMLLAFILLMLMMLWRSEDQSRIAAAEGFAEMPPAERAAVLETARVLQAAGLDPADPAFRARLASVLALGDARPPQDVLERLAQASGPERRKLENLIRGGAWRNDAQAAEAERDAALATVRAMQEAGLDPHDPALREKLESIVALDAANPPKDVLQRLARASDDERRKLENLIRSDTWQDEPRDTVAERVSTRLEAAAAGQAEVTEALRQQLGPVVAQYGGTIDADGALVFPENVLFAAGKADITPSLRSFLAAVCLPWFRTVERSGAAISDLRIEGHASSEWIGASTEQAYLANLALSQARAHAVLSTCLELVPGPEGDWARARATAIGYSSSHPVITDGSEDKAKSRRVVFRVGYDLRGVIDDIQKDVETADPDPAADPAKREIFGTGGRPTQ